MKVMVSNCKYKKFGEILRKLDIPHKDYNGNLDKDLPIILEELF
jgi:hypothetical protein